MKCFTVLLLIVGFTGIVCAQKPKRTDSADKSYQSTNEESKPDKSAVDSDSADFEPQYFFMISPFRLIVNSEFRLNVGRLKDKEGLLAGVSIYSKTVDGYQGFDDTFYPQELFGAGLALQHKYYFGKPKPYRLKFYIGNAINYRLYHIEAYANGLEASGYDDQFQTIAYKPAIVSGNVYINQGGYDLTFGFDAVDEVHFIADIFMGVNVRFSNQWGEFAGYYEFNNDFWDPGYEGILFMFGVRLGGWIH